MKQGLAVAVVAAMMLAGCSGSSRDASTPDSADVEPSPPGGQPVPLGELSKAPHGGHCALDTIAGQPVPHDGTAYPVAAGSPLRVHGWLVDAKARPPDVFQLVLVSKDGGLVRGFVGPTGELRTDVARAMKSEAAALAGYDVTVALGAVPAGTYTVLAWIPGSGAGLVCDPRVKLVVGEGASSS